MNKIQELEKRFTNKGTQEETIEEAVERYRKFEVAFKETTGMNPAELDFNFKKPHTKEEFEKIEKRTEDKYGFTIPKDLKNFYLTYGGLSFDFEFDGGFNSDVEQDGELVYECFQPLTMKDEMDYLYDDCELFSDEEFEKIGKTYCYFADIQAHQHTTWVYFFDKENQRFGKIALVTDGDDEDVFDLNNEPETVCTFSFNQIFSEIIDDAIWNNLHEVYFEGYKPGDYYYGKDRGN